MIQTDERVVRCGAFWTGSWRSPVSLAIASATRPGLFCHVGLWFKLGDGISYSRIVIHEAHIGKGYHCGSMDKLNRWSARNGNMLSMAAFELEPYQMERLFADSLEAMERYRGASGYDGKQLMRLWVWRRILARFGFALKSDPSAVVCSEIVMRLCLPIGVDLREREDETPDEATPNSTRRAWELRKGRKLGDVT